MEKVAIDKFTATTFDDDIIEFIVYNDDTIDCPILGLYNLRHLWLRPRFTYSSRQTRYGVYDVKCDPKFISCKKLIRSFDINDELFQYLKSKDIISYSTEMAYLYNFIDTDGFNNRKGGANRAFKWARKRGPILTAEKQGRFN